MVGKVLMIVLAGVSLVAIFYLSLQPDPMPLGKQFTKPFPPAVAKWIRKSYMEVRHFPAYLAFAALLQYVAGSTRRRAWCIVGALLALAALMEVGQIWVPHRSADVRDFLWGALGILLASLPWLLRKPKAPDTP